MSLHLRDYNIITDEERAQWGNLQQQEIVVTNGKPSALRRSLYRQYPEAVRNHISLFPNNHLDAVTLIDKAVNFSSLVKQFINLINTPLTGERNILNFIKNNEAYFIIGSILKSHYPFGHHSLFIFPEFQLSVEYKVDYLLVGKNSAGYHFVFVELENVYGSITTKSGNFGETFRKGLIQTDDWALWLEQNYFNLRPIFERLKNRNEELPKDFFVFDRTKMHYVVIAGRRQDFNDKTYRLKGLELEKRKLILHYDNLIDLSHEVIGQTTF